MSLQYNSYLSKLALIFSLNIINPLYAAEDVRITVNGKVVAIPCTISTENIIVNFSNVLTMQLSQPGSSSEIKEINLELKNCPSETSNVLVTFTGQTDQTNYFKNNGTAQNIQIQLLDSSDNNKNITNNFVKTVKVDNATSTVSIPLKVRLLSVNGNATAGSVQSIISVTYTYN